MRLFFAGVWKRIKEALVPSVTFEEEQQLAQMNLPLFRLASGFIGIGEGILLLVGLLLPVSYPLSGYASVGFCCFFCLLFYLLCGSWMKSGKPVDAKRLKTSIAVLYWTLTFWGILGSYRHYQKGEQMLIMETVQVLFALVLCAYPATAVLRLWISYSLLGILLYFHDGASQVQVLNFVTIPLFLGVGCTLIYGRMLQVVRLKTRLEGRIESLQRDSRFDALTGLKNRLSLREDFPGYVGKTVFVVMADMDSFKFINDHYGHETGDKILRAVGEVFREVMGEESAYRFGGDEIVVIREGSVLLGTDLMEEVRRRFLARRVLGAQFQPNLSYGITGGFVDSVVTLRSLQREADQKLYEMKNSGGGSQD